MKMAGHKRQFIKNVGSGWLAQTSAAVVGFIMLPYNLSHLGNEVYGNQYSCCFRHPLPCLIF